MMRRRDRRRQETIDDIKDTARSQLADRGPTGISMHAIAEETRSTPSLYELTKDGALTFNY